MTKTKNSVSEKMAISNTGSLKSIVQLQTENDLRESLQIFDTHTNESMNNAIAYVAPKTRRWRIA